jgi:4-coumarate--CoA ligase
VSPEELEEILLKNPKIKDVAVVGLPDEEAGQLPLAFVVKNSDVNLSEEQVQDFLAGVDPMSQNSLFWFIYIFLILDKVSYYKKLRGGVRFIQEIPKTASGKILKKNLYELLSH